MKVKDIESRAINEEKQLQFFITRVSLSIESAIKYIYIYIGEVIKLIFKVFKTRRG